MNLCKLFVIVVMLTSARDCLADMIFTITPTSRVDLSTEVQLTYTVSAKAGTSGTQAVGSYFAQVVFGSISVPPGSIGNITGITAAPVNTPFGLGENSPFTSIQVGPNPFRIRWQSNAAPGASQLVDTIGGVIGSFVLPFARQAAVDYDAAIGISVFTGDYKVDSSDVNFTHATLVSAPGVSTIIQAVPEPGSMTLFGLITCGGGIGWIRRRLSA